MWYRQESSDKYIAGVFKVFIFFTGFSIFFKSPVGLIFSVMVLIVLGGQGIYMKYAGRGLSLINEKERKYYYKESNGEFVLKLTNRGMPLLSGTIKLSIDPIVEPIIDKTMKIQDVRLDKKGLIEISMPFSIGSNHTMSVKLPFTTQKRGLAKIRKVELTIPNPFGFGEVYMIYKFSIKQDAIIFPITKNVNNQLTFPTLKEGDNHQLHSLHEDVLSPVGTREYVLGDSFKRINWKASARKQTLQSKMFEKTSEHTVMLSFNINEGYSITSELENIIEKVAFLGKSFSEKQISYGLAVNIRMFGQVPFLYVPVSSGREHLFKVFEALSLLDYQTITIPYEKTMAYIQKQSGGITNWIHFGRTNERAEYLFRAAAMKKTRIYQLSTDGDDIIPFQFQTRRIQ